MPPAREDAHVSMSRRANWGPEMKIVVVEVRREEVRFMRRRWRRRAKKVFQVRCGGWLGSEGGCCCWVWVVVSLGDSGMRGSGIVLFWRWVMRVAGRMERGEEDLVWRRGFVGVWRMVKERRVVVVRMAGMFVLTARRQSDFDDGTVGMIVERVAREWRMVGVRG